MHSCFERLSILRTLTRALFCHLARAHVRTPMPIVVVCGVSKKVLQYCDTVLQYHTPTTAIRHKTPDTMSVSR